MGDMGYDEDVTRLCRLETIVLPELEHELRAAAALTEDADRRAAIRHLWQIVHNELEGRS